MMLKTGNKKRKAASRGFTLIEVMVAVAVLSFGLVMVYQAFFVVLNSFNYSADYLAIVSWMDEKIWQAQDSIMRTGALETDSTQGEFVARNKKFEWSISSSVLGGSGDLSVVNLQVNWKEAKREVGVTRSCYAKYEQN
jgi:prepilin-type N-terminal cleavage/methylation domain-containing protein